MSLILTDEEIRDARAVAYWAGQLYGDDGKPLPEKQVAKAQHAKILKELKRINAKQDGLWQLWQNIKALIARMEEEAHDK